MTRTDTSDWLLLRGLCRESRHWGDFPQQLAGLPGIEKVTCIDLPGNGQLCRQRTPVRIEELVHQLHCQYRPRQPIYILGLSLGGMIAYHWMQTWPEDIRGIVMINSSLPPVNTIYKRLRFSAIPALLKALLSSGYKRESIIYNLSCESQQAREQHLSLWQLYQLEYPIRFNNVIRQLLLASHCRALDAPPKRPVLLISGARDKLVNPQCSAQLAQRWHMPHLRHTEAGHDLPHDQAKWLIHQIEQWLSETRLEA